MRIYEKPEVTIIEFSMLGDITAIPAIAVK